MTVKFFAHARDLSGTETVVLDLPHEMTTPHLMNLLVERYPKLLELKDHLRLAVNYTYAAAPVDLHNNDEVAVIPPVSGG